MDSTRIEEFSARYEMLDQWEIAELHSRRNSLTPEACIALDQVVAKRGIDLAKLEQIEAAELAQKTAYENEQELLAQKKEARYLKWFLIIGTPIIIFGALFRTEKIYETVVSTLVQGVLIGLIYWAYLKFKRPRNQRRP